MNVLFPFGFPAPTAFYLLLYVLTFALHQAFMHYVLAGSLYVAWTAVIPGRRVVPRSEQPLAAILRDWMPFVLSAAITAGIAPLLFIQVVYQHQFYTANLLLWWRWMMVIPVLIVAFYLLYLVKSSALWRWPYLVRVAISLATATSFVFVGFCWTVNHLLANSEANWPDVYATGSLPFAVNAIVSRMFVWIGGAFATMAVIAGWQLYYHQQSSSGFLGSNEEQIVEIQRSVRTLSRLMLGGLTLALIAGIAYLGECDSESRRIVFGNLIWPYLFITAVGILGQIIGWTIQWRSGRFNIAGLISATVGVVLTLFGVSVIREGLRVRSIDLASLAKRHSDATSVGGFFVFLVAAVLVSLVMVWCVRLVHTGKKEI